MVQASARPACGWRAAAPPATRPQAASGARCGPAAWRCCCCIGSRSSCAACGTLQPARITLIAPGHPAGAAVAAARARPALLAPHARVQWPARRRPQVRSIAEMGAYVSLLEYGGIEGMILLSELSRRRIRSVQKLIKARAGREGAGTWRVDGGVLGNWRRQQQRRQQQQPKLVLPCSAACCQRLPAVGTLSPRAAAHARSLARALPCAAGRWGARSRSWCCAWTRTRATSTCPSAASAPRTWRCAAAAAAAALLLPPAAGRRVLPAMRQLPAAA